MVGRPMRAAAGAAALAVAGSFALRRIARRLSLAAATCPEDDSKPDAEAFVRRDLAAAHALSAHHGYDELVWNHISGRLDEQGAFLVTPGNKHFDEIGADDLIVSSPDNPNITADVIHSMIYKVRPDVGCIVHHHTPAVVAVSCLDEGLRYLTQDGAAFYGRVAYYPWEGVSDNYDECQRIAATVADGRAHTIFLKNHGALTLGATVAEAWVRYYYLDRVCAVQCAVGSKPAAQPDEAVLAHAASQYGESACGRDGAFRHGKLEWPALLRLAERLQRKRERGLL